MFYSSLLPFDLMLKESSDVKNKGDLYVDQ